MPYNFENNRIYSAIQPEQTTTGTPESKIGILGRIFIDIGIAIATIGAVFVTGGSAIPGLSGIAATILPSTIEGAIGATTALVTNTSIDIGEGNTDALTLGLDIGLPFASELLGAGVGAIFEGIPITSNYATKLIEKFDLEYYFEKGTKLSVRKILNAAEDTASDLGNAHVGAGAFTDASGRSLNAEEVKQVVDNMKQMIQNQVNEIEQSFRSITDLLDKVTGATRELIARMLPRLYKTIQYLKSILKQLKNAIGKALNPITRSLEFVETRVKTFLTKTVPEELNIKSRLTEIKARYNIRKQSILQNALIAKYNIQKVDSKWVLGFSTVNQDIDDDGKILNAHLIWWFIPETTAHNGERGAVPEPYGKRPVAMLNVNQAQIDYILKAASKGKFYLDNVSGGKAPTSLFGASGPNVSDVKSNFISKLFKNAVSIIPGYSLFVDIKSSIGQFQKLTDEIVSGTLGQSYFKSMKSYFGSLKEQTTNFIPRGIKQELSTIYNNDKFDGSNILKSVDEKISDISYQDKLGRIKHIKKI